MVLAALLWARMLLPGGSGPAQADAAGAELAGAPAGAVAGVGAVDRTTSMEAALPSARPVEHVAMPAGPRRDLFVVGQGGGMGNRGEIGEVGEKSDLQWSDDDRRRALESMAAARLRVQSVVGGPRPQAVINGRMLTVGDRIEGFELVSVERRSVVLSYEGVVIRLGM